MSRTSRHSPIKRLLREVPRGTPLDTSELAAHGVEPKLASYYAKAGWLVRVGHGVYALPGDEISALGATRVLARQVEGLHVGGKSALALHGIRHNLATRPTLVLWADLRFALPGWFTKRFPSRALFAHLFDSLDAKLARRTMRTPLGVAEPVAVSSPERAVLEMLYEVGTNESFDEARNVFDGLSNIRLDVSGRLLSACTSVKAVRLFLTWSRETDLLDVDSLREHYDLRVGSDSRWVNRLPDGRLLFLKPYG